MTLEDEKMALKEIVHKISTDPSFAEGMRSAPQATLKAAGLELDDGVLASLQAVLKRDVTDDPGDINWFLSQFQTSPR
jgi:hypothetical protein